MNPDKNIHDSEKRLKEAFGKGSPFSTPDGYFEQLPERTMDKIRQSSGKQVRLHGIRKFAAAASIIVLLGMTALLIFSNRDNNSEEALEYSLQDLYELNISSLLELEDAYILSYSGEELPDMQSLMGVDSLMLTQDEIREYLLADNHIEYLIINNY